MSREHDNIAGANKADLGGEILTGLTFSHKSYGETFYRFVLGIDRKSGYRDEIKVMISERLMLGKEMRPGMFAKVHGQVRTYNEEEDGRSRLNIVIFAREFELFEEHGFHENNIVLEGYLCKVPIRRTSPLGREICDIMLAVNRLYNKSDYIPCIAWGRNAAYGGSLEVGTKMEITGRIQSREYRKKDDAGEAISKIAYEVSILKIEE